MNNTKLFLMFLLSYDQYSSVLVLEFMIFAMFIVFDPKCFIVHMMFMFRSRTMLMIMVRRAISPPKFFTCRSVGSESRGNLGVSPICEHGARVYEDR